MRVTILGCGSSTGVPVLGCDCAVCTSGDPKNHRTRASVYVESGNLKLLIDAGPDILQQALREKITDVNAVLFTHAHADHAHGIDDLRNFNFLGDRVLPAYMNAATEQELTERFGYAFLPPIAQYGWFRPALTPLRAEPGQTLTIEGQPVTVFAQHHGHHIEKPEPYITLGIRIGDFAYSTDVKKLPPESLAALRGTKIWVVDCLREEPAPTHAHLSQALEWIQEISPERAYLTHMNHSLDYHAFKSRLPAGVEPAYDGLTFTL